jgi:hypothetical protein
LSTTEEAKAQYHLQKFYRSKLYKTFTSLKSTLMSFFVNYMVWIFHMSVIFGVSTEEPDIFSVILFCVDSVVLIVHLLIDWQAKADRNQRILKWCIPSFSAILLLIICRYSAFYTRYYVGQKGFTNLFKLLFIIDKDTDPFQFFSKESRFYRLFLKANTPSKFDAVPLFHFSSKLFYLTIASLTLMSLKVGDSDDDNADSIFDIENGLNSSPKSSAFNLSAFFKGIKDGNQEIKGESEGKELEMSIVDTPAENILGPAIVPTKIIDDNESSEEIKEEQTAKILEQDFKLPAEGLVKTGKRVFSTATMVLSTIYNSPAEKKITKPSDLLLHSKFLIFFCLLILQRAFTFSIIVYVCRYSGDMLDYSYILMDLGFFILLFHNLGGEFKAFGVEEFFEKNIEFFGKAFTKQLDKLDMHSEEDPVFRSLPQQGANQKYNFLMVQDVEQYCYFLSQLLMRLQTKVAGLTNLVSFIKLGIVTIKSYVNNWLIFYNMINLRQAEGSKNSDAMKINSTLILIILVELLLIKFYKTMADETQLKVQNKNPEGIAAFCNMIQMKLNYYVAYVTEAIWEKEQIKSAKEVHLEISNPFVPISQSERDIEDDDKNSAKSDGLPNFNDKSKKLQVATSKFSKEFSNVDKFNGMDEEMKDLQDSEQVIHKAVKMKVEPIEVYHKQKKEKLATLKKLYKIYCHSQSKASSLFDADFNRTYDQYVFDDPEDLFKDRPPDNEDSGEYEEDEFDLGLSCYEKKFSFIIGIGTPRLLKILLLHKNKHKYHFCSILRGTLYILRRLLLIPILYVVCVESNICNIPLLVIGIYYSFRSHKTILLDMRLFIPIFSCAFFFMFMWNSLLHSQTKNLSKGHTYLRPVPTSCSLI